MQNIAILLYDYSLLGGVQRVTCNLAQLMYNNDFPIKVVISIRDSGVVNYEYPIPVEIIGSGYNMYESLGNVVAKYAVQQVVVQVEDLKFVYPIINHLNIEGCRVYPVLHSSPYNWIKKYYSPREYLRSPRHIYHWLKMKVYWKKLHLRIFRELVNKHGIICVSDQARKELCDILGMSHNTDRVKFVYNPVQMNPGRDVKDKINSVVYAGRLDPDKRPILMLKVWKQLEENYPEWEFIVLGGGSRVSLMKKYIEKRKLQNVRMVGTVNNVLDYLNKSKISILFSKYEGLPTVMLEACYQNNALVATLNDGGTRDVVVDGVNGYLVDAKKVDEIVRKMSVLMNDNGKIALEMARNNAEIRKKFDTKEIASAWREILTKEG